MSNIILIGYRGVGKSTISKKLAERLAMKAISLDDEMKGEVGNLQDYIRANGWEAFRDVESRLVEELSFEEAIIDCGGGVIERAGNISALRSKGKVVWLKVSKEIVYERLKGAAKRLSLSNRNGSGSYLDEIAEVMARRNPLYEQASHIIVDTDRLSIDEIVDEIASKV